MKKPLIYLGLAVGILTASCTGNATSPLPSGVSMTGPNAPGSAPMENVPRGWAATATHAVPFEKYKIEASALRSLRIEKPLHVVVGLYMRDPKGAAQLVRSQYTAGHVSFHKWMTPTEFTAKFNPSYSEAESVAAYLRRQGFTDVEIEPNHLIVSGFATVPKVESAFHTTIRGTTVNGKLIYGNVTPALAPSKLRKLVAAVVGLTNAFQMHAHLMRSTKFRPMTAGTPPPCLIVTQTDVCTFGEYGPTQYQVAYDATNCPDWYGCSTGSKTSIAVMGEGNVTQVQTDLRTAEAFWALPKVPYSVRKVGVSSPDTSGLDEWDLDTQISSGFAQTVKHLYLYDTTSLSDSDIALEYSKWVSDDFAQAGNSSFGEPEEYAYLDGSMVVDDEEMNEAASQGQTMFASTGDNGSGCPVLLASGVPNSGAPVPCYPATSPYIVAVGGTTLDTNAVGATGPCTDCGEPGSYYGEHVWVGTGGGYSAYESPPYWQDNGICAQCTEFRGTADIAMCADNNGCPMDVFVDGSQEGVGGTSLSSPMSMGLWARLESHFSNKLGFAAPVYYGVYGYYEPCPLGSTACVPTGEPTDCTTAVEPPDSTCPIGGFHDIIVGSNGIPSTAEPGWDEPTGLGSIDYYVMQKDISNSIFPGS